MQEYRKKTTSVIYRFKKQISAAIEQVLYNHLSVGERKADTKLPQDRISIALSGEESPQGKQFFNMNEKEPDALIRPTKNGSEGMQQAVYCKVGDTCRQAIFKTESQLSGGAISPGKAIDKATEDSLVKGVNCIAYKNKNGEIIRYVNIADYMEMALRTANHRATLLGENSKRDELDVHLVFISAHMNVCKFCLPWQGQILIDDVSSRPSKAYMARCEDKYKLLFDVIKAGLLCPNCRHTSTTYFEDVTRLPKPQDPEKALEDYNNEQKQQRLEREIRKRKRILAGTMEDKGRKETRVDLRQAQGNLRDFLEEHPEFKHNQRREKVYRINMKLSSALNNFDEKALHGLDERTILEADKALTRTCREYPHLKGAVSGVRLIDRGTAETELDIQSKGLKVLLGTNKNLTLENVSSLIKRLYEQHKWTKKPGIEGIIRHKVGYILNHDYYVRKNKLERGKPYGGVSLQKLINDFEENQLATELRSEILKRLGVEDSNNNVFKYSSEYTVQELMVRDGESFTEAFSNYSDTNAEHTLMELLRERMK